jgi:hypothetical protein
MKENETSVFPIPQEMIAAKKNLDSISLQNKTKEQIDLSELLEYKYNWGPKLFNDQGKFGLFQFDGTILLNPEFDQIDYLEYHPYTQGDLLRVLHDGKHGLARISDNGTFLWCISPDNDYVSAPQQIVCTRKNNNWELIDSRNAHRLSIELTSVSLYDEYFLVNNIGIYHNHDKLGVAKSTGEFTKALFDEIEESFDGPVKVKISDQWGFIDEQGSFTIDEHNAFYFYEI